MQLEVIASLHDWHYIHCDVKPSNSTIWAGAYGVTPTIFLINFGLVWQFCNPTTYQHIPYTTKHLIIGTLPFMSVNGQQGHAQSHHNNLESLAYTIVFLVCGNLPWTAASICKEHKAVLQKKMSITAEELCKGLPPLFSKFVTHVHSLGFNKKPVYQHLYTILSQCTETETDQHTTALPSAPPPLHANHTPSHSNCV